MRPTSSPSASLSSATASNLDAAAGGRGDDPVVGSVLLGARLERQPAGFPPRGRLDHLDAARQSVTGDVRAQQLRDDGVRLVSRKEQRADVGRGLNRILGARDHRAS
jgi:hypothetical protein